MLLSLSTLVASASMAAAALSWPPDQALPQFPTIADTVDFANLTLVTGEERGLLVSLQGIVNRNRPRVYLFWAVPTYIYDPNLTLPTPRDTTDTDWLAGLGTKLENYTADPLALLDKYRSEIRGAVVYDPDVPDTINLATMLAGLNDGVLATAELAQTHNLTVLEDLRGRFAHKLEVYRYALDKVWPQVDDTARRLVTAVAPKTWITYWDPRSERPWTTVLKVAQPVTDMSNNRTYRIDLSGFLNDAGDPVYVRLKDAYASDGWGPSVSNVTVTASGSSNETTVLADFVPGTEGEAAFLEGADGSQVADYPGGWRFADGFGYWVYKFTPPAGTKNLTLSLFMWNSYEIGATTTKPGYSTVNAVFRDYIVATRAPAFWLDPNVPDEAFFLNTLLDTLDTDPNIARGYLGWFPNGDEASGVTQLANKGVYVVAADFLYNGSLMGGTRANITTANNPSTNATVENAVYLAMTWAEGDNLQYNQHRMRTMWDDPARGEVPVGWTISPLLKDMSPLMLNYYQSTATPNDVLVAGPTGAGYTYPSDWPATALQAFVKRHANPLLPCPPSPETGTYMSALNLDIIFAYNRINNTHLPIDPSLAAAYKQSLPSLRGILSDIYDFSLNPAAGPGSAINLTASGVPVAALVGLGSEQSALNTLSNISATWDQSTGREAPVFVFGSLASWDMKPANVSAFVERLGPEFRVVRPDVLFDLVKLHFCSGGGNASAVAGC